MSTETTTAHYLVTTARDHTLKVHRSTCKKALANPAGFATDDFATSLAGQTATPATCCKPKPPVGPSDAEKAYAKRTPLPADVVDAQAGWPEGTTDAARAEHMTDEQLAAAVKPEPAYDPHPGRRADLAVAEGKALRKAKKDGTARPATPNLDQVNAEYAAGIDHHARKQLVAYEATHGDATAKGKRVAKVEVRVRFVRNGKPMPDSQNKLASVAYYHTKDVVAGADRITTDALRQILAAAGVAQPEAEPWGPVTLSNGVVLEATAL